MQQIWKYRLLGPGHTTIQMPKGARILTADCDPMGDPCIWALVEIYAAMVEHVLYVTMTGHDIKDGGLTWIGTFVEPRTRLVLHVFDAGELVAS